MIKIDMPLERNNYILDAIYTEMTKQVFIYFSRHSPRVFNTCEQLYVMMLLGVGSMLEIE